LAAHLGSIPLPIAAQADQVPQGHPRQRLAEEPQVVRKFVRAEPWVAGLREAAKEEQLLGFREHDLRMIAQMGMQPGRPGALRPDDEKIREVRQVDVGIGDFDVLEPAPNRIADHVMLKAMGGNPVHAAGTGVKRQGIRLMPWMKADSSMSGGPLISMS